MKLTKELVTDMGYMASSVVLNLETALTEANKKNPDIEVVYFCVRKANYITNGLMGTIAEIEAPGMTCEDTIEQIKIT